MDAGYFFFLRMLIKFSISLDIFFASKFVNRFKGLPRVYASLSGEMVDACGLKPHSEMS